MFTSAVGPGNGHFQRVGTATHSRCHKLGGLSRFRVFGKRCSLILFSTTHSGLYLGRGSFATAGLRKIVMAMSWLKISGSCIQLLTIGTNLVVFLLDTRSSASLHGSVRSQRAMKDLARTRAFLRSSLVTAVLVL